MTTRWRRRMGGGLLAAFLGASPSCDHPEEAPATPVPPVQVASATLYDADPRHLWNRIAGSLNTWQVKGSAKTTVDLDPLLWPSEEYSLMGDAQRAAVPLLDEFLRSDGEKLIRDPLRRALFQSNLWLLYDWAASSRDRDLERRLAAVLKRVALSADEIRALPDTYAAALASRAYPPAFDPDRPDDPFLPAELLDPTGPWILLGNERGREKLPLAQKHVTFFEGRSSFLIFLKLPDGRREGLEFVEKLRDPKKAPLGASSPRSGSQLALLRRAFVLDDAGRIVPTPIVESLQLRVHGDFPAGRKLPAGFFERMTKFDLRRQRLLAGERGGLWALGPEDREPLYVLSLGFFPSRAADGVPAAGNPLERCILCHTSGGRLESQARMFFEIPRPALAATTLAEEERRAAAWKEGQPSFQRLRQSWKGTR